MANPRTGSVRSRNGKFYARVSFVDSLGKRRQTERLARNKTHAKQLVQDMLASPDFSGPHSFDGAKMTFAELAEYYEKRHLNPPQFVEGKQVAGLRGYREQRRLLRLLCERFGSYKIRDLTHGDLAEFRQRRIGTETISKRQRSMATVNRELALLRRVLNIAEREGWIPRNPFKSGESLIKNTAETKRERILSPEEEARILANCTGERRHLRPIVICALDTGMRRGEIFKLTWREVDFLRKVIVISSLKSKTNQRREVGMTGRLEAELREIWRIGPGFPDVSVFGVEVTIKRSWKTACNLAKVTGLRFHDLRHTAATRLVQGGMPLAEVGRILGHCSPTTTYRYINADSSTPGRAAVILDAFGRKTGQS